MRLEDVAAPYARIAGQYRNLGETRPRAKMLDPSELPPRERPAKRTEDKFWVAAASGKALPKKRRRQTLARASRKKFKIASGKKAKK